ncbi:hypothetical protein [Nocardia farcinica]|uniref:hypothetical protein n=1 Tax=Nocardia farcinica TaxID=37329 RepID=UPI002455ED80|nr:hypothetical protein [Nocardia farcinica]
MAHFYDYIGGDKDWIIESDEPRPDLLEWAWWKEISADEAAGKRARIAAAKSDTADEPETKRPAGRKPAAKADEAA